MTEIMPVPRNSHITVLRPPSIAPSLSVYYKGESDTSNLGSNKGFFDNKMNLYEELAGAVERVTDNIIGLIEYFDAIHQN